MKMNLSSTMVSFGILLALGKLLLKVKNKVEKEVCPLLYVIYFFPNCDQTFKTTPFEAVSTSDFKFNTRANVMFPCPRICRKESVRPAGSDHNLRLKFSQRLCQEEFYLDLPCHGVHVRFCLSVV